MLQGEMVLAIICFGEFAIEVFELAQRVNAINSIWEKIIFVDKDEIEDSRVILESSFFDEYKPSECECVIAIGEVDSRRRIYELYESRGYVFTSLVDPMASVSSTATIEKGAIIFPFVYVAHGVIVKRNAILHAHCIVENDCVVGGHSFVSLGAFVGAGTRIGNVTFVGPNSTIRDKIIIGDYDVIGMGSVVTTSISDELVVVGNPAKVLRKNDDKKIGLVGKRLRLQR